MPSGVEMQVNNQKNNSHVIHLARQIVAQLGEDTAEGLLVLEYAKKMLLQPLDEPEERPTLSLVKGRN